MNRNKDFCSSNSTIHCTKLTINCMRYFGIVVALIFFLSMPAMATDYVGNSATCGGCHPSEFAEWSDTTHTSKLISKDDAVGRGLPSPPSGYSWDNVSYVIGAKWKIRYVNDTGYIITDGGMNQYNIATQEWVDYHKDETRVYNCGHCHNTGYLGNMSDETREPWRTLRSQGQYPAGVYNNSLAPGFAGYWAENSVGCEACHGPGGDHISAPSRFNIVNASVVSNSPEICGDCHVRQSDTHLIKVGEIDLIATLSDSSPSPLNGTIDGQHHEQWEDWYDSGHKNAGVDCVECHGGHSVSDPAYADGPTGKTKFIDGTVFPATVVEDCVGCHITPKHSYYNDNAECISCHMPKVRKSAIAYDIRSHWFDPNAIAGKDGSPHADGFGDLQNLTESCITCHTSPNISEQINVT
ncbi:MAG: hypothetical protein KAH86_03800, partial [Methanosarcinales archaeon]|nr:hypothetical protein [Methanosarcinales archaeon]